MAKKQTIKIIEQYEHSDKERANNPHVGLVTPASDPDTGEKKTYQYDPHLDPQLQWAGKAEHTSFEVPTVSLHVHERIDPNSIIETVKKERNGQKQMSLFETNEKPLREAIDFYKHKENWSNRLIAGDSLLVMNSLLEKEGMAGKVQMVYFDPPYGIKYGSNFQPFVNKRDVKDGKDEDLSAEPEMIKAFRDTWELGIHSYLTYLRDRLLLARELLNDSGSVFVQIGDENIHHVREIMDEIFGVNNFFSIITFKKTLPLGSSGLAGINDFILWYAKDKVKVKFNELYSEKPIGEGTGYTWVELENGERRKMTKEEKLTPGLLPKNSKVFFTSSLSSSGYTSTCMFDFEFEGKVYKCGAKSWRTTEDGIKKLIQKKRIMAPGNLPTFIQYHDDFPVQPIHNMWNDTHGATDLKYVVQTSTKVIQRCLMMTTDPGDLILDITCGSGTSAYVAEEYGRRWMTCDTSRVSITLAKQKLMSAIFDYYKLAHPNEGISSGFEYKTVPHVTLSQVANEEPFGYETLIDQPKIDNSKARITGPFTVEAVPAPYAKSFDDLENDTSTGSVSGGSDTSIARTGETLRQSEWRDELLKSGVRAKGGNIIQFTRVEPLAGTKYIQAEAETKEDTPKKVLVVFGPEHAPLEQRMVENAWQEARALKPDMLLFCAFQFDEEAAKDIDELTPAIAGMQLLKAQMNADMLTDDLRKNRSSNESFWLVGQPDVVVYSGQWLVDSNSNKIWTSYECIKKFSGLDSVAKIQSLSREDLCFYLALSEGRDLWHELANAAGCRVSAPEHSRRASEEYHRGIQTIFRHSQRLDGGIGDLDRIITGFESAEKGGFRKFIEGLRRNSKIIERIAQIAKLLTTNHYTLTTKNYSQVEVMGFDYYNPKTGNVESGGKKNIAMWMLDTDYDNRSLFPSQVFFPMAGIGDGWDKLAKNLKAEIDEEKIESFKGTLSLEFEPGNCIAVKIIDDRGIESLRVINM